VRHGRRRAVNPLHDLAAEHALHELLFEPHDRLCSWIVVCGHTASDAELLAVTRAYDQRHGRVCVIRGLDDAQNIKGDLPPALAELRELLRDAS
jgi:hypothetical protein